MFFYINVALSRDSEWNGGIWGVGGRGGRQGGGKGKGEGDFFNRDGGIVIGPLHARTYKSMTADNPLFRINIVAFFSSTSEASRARFK